MSDETIPVHAQAGNFENMTPEQKNGFFQQLGLLNPQISPERYEFFAFVVDDAVAVVFMATKDHMQKYIDTLSSNPTIVKLTPQQKNVVLTGWNYDSETGEFSEPE